MRLRSDQLEALRAIVRNASAAVAISAFGYEPSDEELDRLIADGWVTRDQLEDLIGDAFHRGLVVARSAQEGADPVLGGIKAIRRAVQEQPLSAPELEAAQVARERAGSYAVGLGDRYASRVVSLAVEQSRRDAIERLTGEAVEKRRSTRQLASDLRQVTEDWSRDWERIANTELHQAHEEGFFQATVDRFGPEELLAKIPDPDACPKCRGLYLDSDGQPLVRPASWWLDQGASNAGRKAADWQPVIGPAHPHCRCRLIRVPRGWTVTAEGSLEPPEVEKSLVERMAADPEFLRRTEQGYEALEKGQFVTLQELKRRLGTESCQDENRQAISTRLVVGKQPFARVESGKPPGIVSRETLEKSKQLGLWERAPGSKIGAERRWTGQRYEYRVPNQAETARGRQIARQDAGSTRQDAGSTRQMQANPGQTPGKADLAAVTTVFVNVSGGSERKAFVPTSGDTPLAGRNIGAQITAADVPRTERGRERFARSAREHGVRLMIDSGEFGRFARERAGKAAELDFDQVFEAYEQMSQEMPPDRLAIVAPDRIANPEMTAALRGQYADRVKALAAKGVEVIVPIQARSAEEIGQDYVGAAEAFGEGFTIGFPTAAAVLPMDQILPAMVQLYAHGRFPRVHFLGGGRPREMAERTVQLVAAAYLAGRGVEPARVLELTATGDLAARTLRNVKTSDAVVVQESDLLTPRMHDWARTQGFDPEAEDFDETEMWLPFFEAHPEEFDLSLQAEDKPQLFRRMAAKLVQMDTRVVSAVQRHELQHDPITGKQVPAGEHITELPKKDRHPATLEAYFMAREHQTERFAPPSGSAFTALFGEFEKSSGGGPFIGPRGGKWADAAHTIPWKEEEHRPGRHPEQPEQLDLFALGRQELQERLEDPTEWRLPAGARIDDPWEPDPISPTASWSHPDYGSGRGAAPWQQSPDWHPDLHSYDYLVVNSSAGKDSQAMLSHLVELADAQGYPRDKIVVVHADLGRVEWAGTKELAKQQAEHYGVRFEVVQRSQNDLVGHVEARYGDLMQQQADAGALLEAGIASWHDLATADIETVQSIIGEGKGSSQYDSDVRARKLIQSAARKIPKLEKKRATNLAVAQKQRDKVRDRLKVLKEKIRTAGQAGKQAPRSVREGAEKTSARLEQKQAVVDELESWSPATDRVDFGKPIAWPSSQSRYCTSEHKRAEVQKLHTQLAQEHRDAGGEKPVRILNTLGIRAQEGEGRSKMPAFSREEETRRTKKDAGKTVDRWYPIHLWPEHRVWKEIQESGVPHHKAYNLGMRRLSCVFCVFAGTEDLMIAAKHNPDLFRTYLKLEEKVGASFKADQSLADIRDEIARRREAGYELNELAEWVKKSLGLEDLIKAEVVADLQREPPAVGVVLEAAYRRLGRVLGVQIEWKVKGACFHLDTARDSHHVLYLPYPDAYNASLMAAAFAQRHGIEFEEHNAPPPLNGSGTPDGQSDIGSPGTPGELSKAFRLQGRREFRGLQISVEQRKGGVRRWHNPHDGTEGRTKMTHPYGYIRGSLGTDGDHVDCFIGPDEQAPKVYVVHTRKAPAFREYDEDKCMLGFNNRADAVKTFLRNYDDPRFLGSVTAMPFEEFKRKVLETPKRRARERMLKSDPGMRLLVKSSSLEGKAYTRRVPDYGHVGSGTHAVHKDEPEVRRDSPRPEWYDGDVTLFMEAIEEAIQVACERRHRDVFDRRKLYGIVDRGNMPIHVDQPGAREAVGEAVPQDTERHRERMRERQEAKVRGQKAVLGAVRWRPT